MKKCQKCGYQNADEMRFCLECGAQLPDAPIIVSWQDSGTQKQSNIDTASFGQSMQTKIGSGRSEFPNNFPVTSGAQNKTPGGSKKMLIVGGGIAALLILVFAAGAAIVGYNIFFPSPKPPVTNNQTPTPAPSRSNEKSPTPKPSATPKPTAEPSATPEDSTVPPATGDDDLAQFKRMWVDYNVTEKGRRGMRIHVDFSVYRMKGVGSYLAVFFQHKDGAKLLTNRQGYRSKDGQVAVYKSLKPAFDNTDYNDAQVFMPYDELNLETGDYELQMDVDLIYESGELAKHLNLYDFDYEKE